MENIHVILCGTDAFQAENVLQGVVEKEHYAWNKRYRFSCASALSVDKVDSRLLLVCHMVVLCKGCRSPKDKNMYNGRPVVSLPDATPACVEEVRDSEFYYGPIQLADLREAVVSIALAPSHVVYDSLLQCLTPLGDAAFQRAFWLLDKNNDGVLDRDELLAWTRLTRSDSFTEQNLVELLASVEDVIGACPHLNMSEDQFHQLHQNWLENGDTDDAWATLHAVGTHTDGLPYSWYDLHSMRVDRDVNTYLSPHAIQFFRNLYKLKNFKDAKRGGIWRFTPGCPWSHIDGMSSAPSVPLDKFIEYWKYMALERRDAVIMYARYWGYKGDAGFLFVQRNARASRAVGEPLPNTLQVLVVGAESCGRKSLIFELTTDGREPFDPRRDAPLYVRTTTFYAEKTGGGGGTLEEPQTIVYTTIAPEKAEVILTNEFLNKTFDIVLLCVDGSDYGASSAYIMSLHGRAVAANNCASMAYLLVMTKSDLMEGDETVEGGVQSPPSFTVAQRVQAATRSMVSRLRGKASASSSNPLADYAAVNRLLWPPIMTSALRPEESELAMINEYMYSVAAEPELAIGKAPLTWVKVLRRGTFTAMVVVGTIGILQKVGQWAFSRRKE